MTDRNKLLPGLGGKSAAEKLGPYRPQMLDWKVSRIGQMVSLQLEGMARWDLPLTVGQSRRIRAEMERVEREIEDLKDDRDREAGRKPKRRRR